MAPLPNDLARVRVDQLKGVEHVIARPGRSFGRLAHEFAREHKVGALELAAREISGGGGSHLASLLEFAFALEISHAVARKETDFAIRALVQERHDFLEEN